ncbi:MAG TPA: amino acid adenylation domain-containing protein, partial [Longimicrobiaceae bacterium]|nr:amino acid adenylation domain-containing protein [Longimicrobiaceae bacterium]
MENVESVYALSPMQADILLRAVRAPELHEYVELVTWTLRGPFDPEAFAGAWRHVAARHPVLRTSFLYEGREQPVQVVRRHVEVPVEAEDWRGVPAAEREERFRGLLRAERERDFDLGAAPLLRVRQVRLADDEYRFAWCYHHLLLDGWSAVACVREVLEAYAALAAGAAPAPGPAAPYADYVAWLARQDDGEAERFWRAALAGVEPPAPLPLDGARGADGAGYRVETAVLPAELGEALRAASRRLRVSPDTPYEAAWGLLLARYTGADEAVFGAGAAGRPADLPGAEGMLGVLLRVVPVRVRPEPAARVGDWLGALQRARQEARLHDTAPLVRIREWSGLPRGQRLFEHFFLFQDLPGIEVARAELGGAELSGFRRVPPDGAFGHTLMLAVVPRDEVVLELTHPSSLDTGDARRLLEHYRALLEALAADPARRVGDLGVAARWPDRVALVSGDEKLTFAQLEEARLAGSVSRPSPDAARLRQRLAGLSPEQLSRLRDRLQAPAAAAPTIPRRPGGGPAPLSFAQQRLWFLDRMAPGGAAYNVPSAVRLDGTLDPAALERSVGALVRRHEALRTVFAAGEAGPVQVVLPAMRVPLEAADLGALPPDAREAEAARLLRREARRPFDLAAGPLLRTVLVRLEPERHLLLLVSHHVVTDGWSLRVMLRDLSALYAARAGGVEPSLPPLPVQYPDYAAWQRERLQGALLREQLDYWTSHLRGAPPALELPADRPRPAVQSFEGAWHRFRVPAATTDPLRRLARREQATLFMVFLAAFDVLLSRLTGQTDVVVGTPIANRGRPETAELVGFFANTLAMRADLSGDPTFPRALRGVRRTALGAYEHEELPFERLVEELNPERDLSRTVVFQVAFSFDAADAASAQPLRLPGLEMAPADVDPGLSAFDLTLRLESGAHGVAGVAEYATALFDAGTVERMAECFAVLVEGIAAAPDRRLSELPLLREAERLRLAAWSAGPAAGPAEGTVHERFGARARLAPDALAVESAGDAPTCAELEARANRLAHHLRGRGVGPETRVGICLEPGTERVVAMLGVLKAGGAYLPLDPEYPAERLAWMLEDAAAPVLVARSGTADRLSADGVRTVVLLDADADRIAAESAEAPVAAVDPGNLAYVVYTSGSTGRPKGVMVSHAALLNLCAWHGRAFGVTAADRAAQLASFSFDAAVWETWPYLLAGASLHPVDAETRASPEALRALLLERGITLTFAPTALAEALLGLEWPERTPLRALLTGGDALRVRPRPGLPFALVNDYGPTEAAVVATSGAVDAGEAARAPSIGRPIDGVTVRVLDPHGGPVPTGVAGELYVGGAGVARGYLGRPALTAETFVPDAFSGEWGARMYRTGDRARWLADGELEFLGRTDRQVKVRGFRIEPGEVEAALSMQPGVREAAVEVRDGPGGKRLVGYVVAAEGSAVDAAGVRAGLRERLPDPMVPAALVVLDRMPLTPAGKLDRAALPEPDSVGTPSARTAPATPTELLLADVWAEVLGGERPAPGDDFFALGGHSLLAARVVSRVRETLGVAIPVRALFEAPTLGGLAGRVDALRTEGAAARAPIEAVPRGGPLPVSPAQGRIWLQHHLSPAPESYNLGVALRLRGPLSPAALRAALEAVVARHEALRTRFVEERGEPVQVVEPPMPLPLPAVDLSRLPAAEREARVARLAADDMARPFDLERAPLVRGALLRLGADEHVLLVAAHHVAFDGWSAGVLTRELREHYAAALAGRPADLPPLAVQYGDYAAWERKRLEEPEFQRKLEFWAGELAGAPSAV